MSFNIDKLNGNQPISNNNEQGNDFKFKRTQIGSIFLEDNGDGKVSAEDFNRTTKDLDNFISKYINSTTKWTQDVYNKVVDYLENNKDDIKNDYISETISSFKTKRSDFSQIEFVDQSGEWTIIKFKDGTYIQENKAINCSIYFDSSGRCVAGTEPNGTNYMNTYYEEITPEGFAYYSEEAGNNTISYYNEKDIKLMEDNGIEKKYYHTDEKGKLESIEIRNSKTNKLDIVGIVDESGSIEIIREYKVDKNGKTYYQETDTKTNQTKKVYVDDENS